VVDDGLTFIPHNGNQSQANQADQQSNKPSPTKPSVSVAFTNRFQALDDDEPSATPSNKPSTAPIKPRAVPSAAPSLEPSAVSNNAIAQCVAISAIASKTLGKRIKLLHACAGSPSALSSFKTAIDECHCTTWPKLTLSGVIKCLLAPGATIQGHLDQQRKGIQSTKP
jgi:hypothetical protein